MLSLIMDTVYRVSVLMKIITTWSINCSWDCNIQAQTRMKEKGSEEEHEEGYGEEHEEGYGVDQKGERSGYALPCELEVSMQLNRYFLK